MKPKVLFVDDDAEIIDGLKRALRKEPYEIVWAYSGSEALEILSKEKIAVLVSDEKMPGMTGSELLSRVRQMYPSMIRIMLTGNANVESAMNAIYDGWVYQYLHKPVKAADLASTIHNGLLLQSLRMDGESPHLVMTAEQQNALLSDVAGREDRQPAVPDTAPKSELAKALDEINSAVARAGNASSTETLLAEVKSAIERIEAGLN